MLRKCPWQLFLSPRKRELVDSFFLIILMLLVPTFGCPVCSCVLPACVLPAHVFCMLVCFDWSWIPPAGVCLEACPTCFSCPIWSCTAGAKLLPGFVLIVCLCILPRVPLWPAFLLALLFGMMWLSRKNDPPISPKNVFTKDDWIGKLEKISNYNRKICPKLGNHCFPRKI